MAFNESRFETGYIVYATDGGPSFSTEVVVVNSGFENRNQVWQYPLGKWDFGDRKLPDNELNEIITFFHAMAGMAIGFRFKDWGDYTVTTANGTLGPIGLGTGLATYQLTKSYTIGGAITQRLILKPVAGTITCYKNGVQLATYAASSTAILGEGVLGVMVLGTGTEAVVVDYTTGLVTFQPPYPTSTDVLTFSGEFDIPVRFDTDHLKYRFDGADVTSPGVLGTKYFYLSTLPIVEVRV